MSCKARIAALALGLTCAVPAWAAQFGLVVGIDDYRHFQKFPVPAGELSDLEGAVNDALRIARAMRQMKIDLPDSRLLIDAAATEQGFLNAWRSMLAQAAPGDTLIVTFSGHGGQEKEIAAPFDETTDGLDETIMFHDFDPANPRIGRLSDDQLREVLSEAAAFNVIWVMDSCHSAGLTRSANPGAIGLTRNGGVWDIPVEPVEGEVQATQGDDESDALPNVTQILATASEDRLVTETRFDDRPHGALSWFFAEAITGAADTNGDGVMTRAEIADFLEDRVFTHMNQNQQPRILPRGDATRLLSLTGAPPPPPPVQGGLDGVPIKFVGAPPPGLAEGSFKIVDTSPKLVFQQTAAGWDVFNHTGDRVTSIRDNPQRMIARARALDHLQDAKKRDVPPVRITLGQDATTQRIGSIVGFSFTPPTPDHVFLTLFNIASDGTLQYLHPGAGPAERPVDAQGFPIRFQVTPPTGADQLVAVFCTRPPLDLRRALQQMDGQTVPADDTLPGLLSRGDCQVGMTGLFTEG
ncbi:caspase family protein [Mesobacterium sp. TK19101]|uniref:Caspase family protein n=1 Tax=Mesobacterium hydrothermale TaxID=3111907 RepID=A0ABU6HB82_9RHOB|nr:caspase family protein [Mesobacterium sp. TK19101]MEC3859712.1 caspase family protein [Mesobacterium sp. TK19101]